MARQIGWMCLAIGLVSIASSDTCDAQLRVFDQIVQRPFRALGHGTGPGHHRCNPGPDTSYYNPWTQKNSFLISKSPEYLNRFGYEDRSPMYLLHSGQSAYSLNGSSFGTGFSGQTLPLTADFIPTPKTRQQVEQPPAADDSNSSGDFVPPSKKVDDSFEKEAEAIDKSAKDKEVGGFDSLNDSDDLTTLELPSVFLPTSHSKN